MKTYNSSNGHFSAAVQVDSNGTIDIGYIGSSSGAVFTIAAGVASGIYTYLFSGSYTPPGSPSTPIRDTKYTSAPDGTLRVSLRKYLAMAGPGGTVTLTVQAEMEGMEDTLTMTLHAVPGVSYQDISIPRDNEMVHVTGNRHAVVPPNVMLVSEDFPAIIAETSLANVAIPSGDLPLGVWQGYQPGYSPVTLSPSGERNNSLEISTKYTRLTYSDGGLVHSWDLQQPDVCTDIVLLRWTSQTGAVRQHVFIADVLEASVDGAAILLSLGDGFRVAKNVSNGIKVRIDGLTPLGWWYYADMLLASDLHAMLPGQTGDIGSEFYAAFCTEEQAAMPAGNGFVSFGATIKMKHYDSF